MIFVVGGGPSLIGFDWSRLRGQRVIAVNAAYADIPWAEALVFADARFYEWNHKRPEWAAFEGRKITTWRRAPAGVERRSNSPYQPLSRDPKALAGECSGAKALNLAYQTGCKTIYLLGYDMQANGNYHSRHVLGARQGRYPEFVASLTAMIKAIQASGVTVINACPHSGVTIAPRIPLMELPV